MSVLLSNTKVLKKKMYSVLRERVNKRLVQTHIRVFAAQCRGIIEKI